MIICSAECLWFTKFHVANRISSVVMARQGAVCMKFVGSYEKWHCLDVKAFKPRKRYTELYARRAMKYMHAACM